MVGDHVPSEDRGDAEEAGECIVKVCAGPVALSLVGEESVFTSHFIFQAMYGDQPLSLVVWLSQYWQEDVCSGTAKN